MRAPAHSSYQLSSGRKVPWLAFGNGSGPARQQPELVAQALLGFRHFDTAQDYLNRDDNSSNEQSLGDVVKACDVPREELYLVTKISQEFGDPARAPVELGACMASVKDSIKKLGTQPDLILFHSPMVCGQGAAQIVEYWQALEKLKDDGPLTADLGVSNFLPEQIEAIMQVARHPIVCHQLEMHPLLLAANKSLLDVHAKYNIRTAAYSPLAPLLKHPKQGGRLKLVLDRIAERIDADAATVLLLWCKARGFIAVTTSASKERMQKLVDIEKLPQLTDEEVEEINKVGSSMHFRGWWKHFIGFDERNGIDLPSE